MKILKLKKIIILIKKLAYQLINEDEVDDGGFLKPW